MIGSLCKIFERGCYCYKCHCPCRLIMLKCVSQLTFELAIQNYHLYGKYRLHQWA